MFPPSPRMGCSSSRRSARTDSSSRLSARRTSSPRSSAAPAGGPSSRTFPRCRRATRRRPKLVRCRTRTTNRACRANFQNPRPQMGMPGVAGCFRNLIFFRSRPSRAPRALERRAYRPTLIDWPAHTGHRRTNVTQIAIINSSEEPESFYYLGAPLGRNWVDLPDITV